MEALNASIAAAAKPGSEGKSTASGPRRPNGRRPSAAVSAKKAGKAAKPAGAAQDPAARRKAS